MLKSFLHLLALPDLRVFVFTVEVVLVKETLTEMLLFNLVKNWYILFIFHYFNSFFHEFFFNKNLIFFLGFLKVAKRLKLVYGGGSIGLMGLVSQTVHQGGGHVIGYKT